MFPVWFDQRLCRFGINPFDVIYTVFVSRDGIDDGNCRCNETNPCFVMPSPCVSVYSVIDCVPSL